MIDIPAIKARADKATDDRFSLAGTYFDHATNMWMSGVHIDGHGGSGPAIVIKGNSVEFCNALRDFIAHARTDIPALIAALEASEAARVKAEQALRTVQNAAKTLAYSRDSELQHLRENGTYDHKLRAEHDSLIDRDALMTDRITALEQERDALKKALTAVRDDLQVRAVKNVVAVGVSVWIEVNTALEAKP